MSRLPTPGQDDNTWGDVLNDYLKVSHNLDGTIKTGIITTTEIADGTITTTDISATAGITKTQLATAVQTSLGKADTALQSVPDATTTSKGQVQLAGDLGGTAAAPTVPTKLSLTGGTLTGNLYAPTYESVMVTSTANAVITPNDANHANVPLASQWHDLLGFGRAFTATTESSTNNTAWTSSTTNIKLFAQLDNQDIAVITSGTNTGVRSTFAGSSFSLATWLRINYSSLAGSPTVTVKIESSTDNSTWTTRHTSSYAPQTGPYLHYSSYAAGDTYFRVTLTSTSGATIGLSSIKLYSERSGNQGYGRELEFPYSWNENGYIGVNKGLTAPSYPLDVTGDARVTGQIHSVTDPTAAQDAATKNYVDTNAITQAQLTSYAVDTTSVGIPFIGTNGITITETSSAIAIGYSGGSGGNGAIGRTVAAITTTTTAAAVANTDYVYYWSGSTAYTLTLPTAASNTNRYTLKNASTISQSVATTASQTIEGGSSITITASNSVDLISNGSNWMVI